eukprot:TRINITY_DN30536_c0_g1_i1.p1 TRINITY_DN30536_c0_g1~~TRINITY_DN30536_c0_g1_i1.p1  ORF type:complete len:564 (+),score=62.72 TRINITY_DN30536_c0_g1_i1:88-1779(+)
MPDSLSKSGDTVCVDDVTLSVDRHMLDTLRAELIAQRELIRSDLQSEMRALLEDLKGVQTRDRSPFFFDKGSKAQDVAAHYGGPFARNGVAGDACSCKGSDSNVEAYQEDEEDLPVVTRPTREQFLSNTRRFTRSDTMIDRIVGELDSPPVRTPDAERALMAINSKKDGCFRQRAKGLVQSATFHYFTGSVILLNGLSVGFETHLMASKMTLESPPFMLLVELIFCLYFTSELFIRIYVLQWHFFSIAMRWWNIFDIIVVFLQWIDLCLQLLEFDMNSSIGKGIFSLMRYLRFIRILRLARAFHFIAELRTIVYSIVFSMRPLFWTILLLAMILYVVSVYFVQVVLYHRASLPDGQEANEVLVDYFGTLPRAMLAMFMSVTGGVDWDSLARPLTYEISPMLGLVFTGYIAVTVLAMLNVITGVFVEAVTAKGQSEKDLVAAKGLRDVLAGLDVDADGLIAWSELSSQLSSKRVSDHLKAMGMDLADARVLYNLLDCDGSGTIDIDEFLRGCLRLRGPAKELDVLLLLREAKMLNNAQADWLSGLTATRPSPEPSRSYHTVCGT